MQGRPVVLRTLDLGADKALNGNGEGSHSMPNPAMGLRAIRFCLAEPQMFLTQLRAILRASHYGKVRILLPMLAHAHEIDQTLTLIAQAKAQLDERGQPYDKEIQIGGMIEIPAAALALPIFMRRLNFLSIGTNDLIQYTLAIDRTDDSVAHLYDPLHPGGAHARRRHHPDRHARRHPGRGVRRDGRRPAAHAPAARPGPAQLLDAPVAAAADQGKNPAHQPRRGADARAARAARDRPGEDPRAARQTERLGGFMRIVLLLLLLVASPFTYSQTYPSSPVKLVVPFPAGSATDQVARLTGSELQAALGQPFVVENKPGAQGGIAAAEVARAAPDGYTLMVTTNTPQAANVSLFKKLNYDPVKDFAPIARLGTTSFMLMVRPDFPAKNLKEFLAHVRKQPGKLSAGYGSAGSQVSLAMLKSMGKLDVVEVPYKGIPQAITDTMGGSLAFTFVDLGNALAQAKGGKLRGLAVTSQKRTPLGAGRACHRRRAAGLRAHRLVRADGAGEDAERDRAEGCTTPR